MPKFSHVLKKDDKMVYVFDYSSGQTNRQMLSMSSCIYPKGWRPLNKMKEDHPNANIVQGQEFEAYVVKTKNGPYDYCTKLWDIERVPPITERDPKADQPVEGLVIDKLDHYFGVGCGKNLAYCRADAFLEAGIDPNCLQLPCSMKFILKRSPPPPLLPYTAWEAVPYTEVEIPEVEQETGNDQKTIINAP